MLRSLLDVFNERDATRRSAAIAAVYTPDVSFHESDGVTRGQAALGARVQQLLDGAPGWAFRPAGAAAVNHDLGCLTWHFGPDGASPGVAGTDVALVADGRIRSLYVFIHAPENVRAP
jgi:hypothetical protein